MPPQGAPGGAPCSPALPGRWRWSTSWRAAVLTRTFISMPMSRGLRTVRTGCAYQPPACCTYRRHRAACPCGPLLHARRMRTSLGRAARTPYRGTPGACRRGGGGRGGRGRGAGRTGAAAALRTVEACLHTVAASDTYGCSPVYMRLQPPLRTVAAPFTCGCSLRYIRLQPPLRTVAASITYGLHHVVSCCSPHHAVSGCSPRHVRLQPSLRTVTASARYGYRALRACCPRQARG